jgi:hypothetical protein
VNWDTTAKTTGFTAVSGVGYFCDTTSAGFTVTLPATPSAGDIVGLVDYAGTFDTNALTIDPNGEDILDKDNLQLTGEREGVVLIYVDSTQGWLPISGINEGTDALSPVPYSIDFLVVAGGGGGGSSRYGGGGGAGGYRTSTQSVTGGTVITVTVGDGGGITPRCRNWFKFFNIRFWFNYNNFCWWWSWWRLLHHAPQTRNSWRFRRWWMEHAGPGGAILLVVNGNTPSTDPSQGNNGGNGIGGGMVEEVVEVVLVLVGNNSGTVGGVGGMVVASSITGSSVTRAGGGGGGGNIVGWNWRSWWWRMVLRWNRSWNSRSC